jgi:hypothetical protein
MEVGLGLIWAAVTVATVYGGSIWLALWLAPVGALAAASTLRTWEGGTDRRSILATGAGAAAIPLAAVAGLLVAAGVAVVAIGLVLLAGWSRWTRSGSSDGRPPSVVLRMVILIGPAAACGAAVLARNHGLDQALVLVGMVCVYDSAAYLIGTGANNSWEGPVAGVACIAALTLLVAAVLFAPYRGDSPWILGGVAAVLAPLGPSVARRLTSDASARVPALKRLDSLLLLGPAWAAGVALLLRH